MSAWAWGSRKAFRRVDGALELGALSLFYLAVVLPQALLKLLWGDELITLYIARQGSPGRIWAALAAGADPNPPLIHLTVLCATNLFGVSALAIRIPSMCFGLMTVLALWTILRRICAPVWAAAGVLGYLCTRGFDYNYDARSYAPMMAATLGALAFWMAMGEVSRTRRMALEAGLAVSIALAVSANYYCVLAVLPVAAGELVRAALGRGFRPGIWTALALGSLPLALYLPLVRHDLSEFGPHAWNPARLSMVGLAYVELVEGIFWPVLALAAWRWWRRRQIKPLLSAPEATALGVLLAYPWLGYGLALAGSAMISPRCVAPVCCGFGLALGVMGQELFCDRRRAGRWVVLLLVCWVLAREGACARLLQEQRRAFLALRDQVDAAGATQIIVGDSSFVLPLAYYADPAIRPKIVAPIDFDAIHRQEPDDSGEQNLWGGRHGVFPFPVLTMPELQPQADALVIARPGGWLAAALVNNGYLLTDGPADQPEWGRLGGVFTPMAHPVTRLMRLSGKPGMEKAR